MPVTVTHTSSHYEPRYCGRELMYIPELQEILKLIEELRSKLNRLSDGKPLTDPEVIAASQTLDAVLNEYQRLMKDKNHS